MLIKRMIELVREWSTSTSSAPTTQDSTINHHCCDSIING